MRRGRFVTAVGIMVRMGTESKKLLRAIVVVWGGYFGSGKAHNSTNPKKKKTTTNHKTPLTNHQRNKISIPYKYSPGGLGGVGGKKTKKETWLRTSRSIRGKEERRASCQGTSQRSHPPGRQSRRTRKSGIGNRGEWLIKVNEGISPRVQEKQVYEAKISLQSTGRRDRGGGSQQVCEGRTW